MILDHTIAATLNAALKGLPLSAINWSPNGAPGWQNNLVERVLAADACDRMHIYKTAIAGLPDRAAIEAEVFSADRNMDLEKIPQTDIGNAEMLAAFYGDRLRFDHRRNRWLVWEKSRWVTDNDGEVQRLVIDTIRRRMEIVIHIQDSAKRKEAIKFCLQSESASHYRAIAEIGKVLRPITDNGKGWDADPWLLGCTNGVVDLKTGQLHQGHPTERISMSTKQDYDPDAKAPRWEAFLSQVFNGDQEMISFVQKAFGYAITGDVREQCLFLCWGGGANGKSTLLTTIRKAIGEYANNTSFSTFELSQRGSQSNDLAALSAARLVTAAETNETSRLNEARVKAITGGDPITARFLYSEYFDYIPGFKVFLAMNHLPAIYGTDTGIWRRIRLIPFTVSFLGREDKTLDAQLEHELPGILAWLVRGALLWQQDGLTPPETVTKATEAYRMDSDLVLQFLESETVLHEKARIKAGDLYGLYLKWCQSNHDDPMNQQTFGRRMRERGFEKIKQSGAHHYLGVGLPTEHGMFKDD